MEAQAKEVGQQCAYCVAGVCEYGQHCVGQTAMHPASAGRELSIVLASARTASSQDARQELVNQRRSRRRPHRRRRCRNGRRQRRARANVHVQPAAQAPQSEEQDMLQSVAAQEVKAAFRAAHERIAKQLEEHKKETARMHQEHQAMLTVVTQTVATQTEATEDGQCNSQQPQQQPQQQPDGSGSGDQAEVRLPKVIIDTGYGETLVTCGECGETLDFQGSLDMVISRECPSGLAQCYCGVYLELRSDLVCLAEDYDYGPDLAYSDPAYFTSDQDY